MSQFERGIFFMKLYEYRYYYEPEVYDYIMSSRILDKKKHENLILKELIKGKTCKEIGKKYNYSERTIQDRRRDIYNKTKNLMIN